MAHAIYNTSYWRSLPRTGSCVLAELLPDDCSGQLERHHVEPMSRGGDPVGSTVLVCKRHHPMLEALARKALEDEQQWKRCHHIHRTRESREACERRLNRAA